MKPASPKYGHAHQRLSMAILSNDVSEKRPIAPVSKSTSQNYHQYTETLVMTIFSNNIEEKNAPSTEQGGYLKTINSSTSGALCPYQTDIFKEKRLILPPSRTLRPNHKVGREHRLLRCRALILILLWEIRRYGPLLWPNNAERSRTSLVQSCLPLPPPAGQRAVISSCRFEMQLSQFI